VAVERLLDSLRPGGRDFEVLCRWILENAPEYRRRVKRVWLWDEWPGRWGRDAGIDLVAEDHEGGLWAIQAKHYHPAYAIKKADLDSFLSESSRPGFTYRLVIASTDHLGPTARRTLDAQEKPVGVLLRSQLDALDADWPVSIARLRPGKVKRKHPRPHQRQAIYDCETGLSSADRGQLVMACGTGKTLVGAFLAEHMSAKRVLVLVPSLSLLSQTLREWATATEFDYIAVCSDETVAKSEHDAVVASTSELGVPVTTDADRIARFLRRRGDGARVVFSTYQSSAQIAAAQTRGVPTFDLVIADEAHRCAGPQAGVFAAVLDPRRIQAHKRLFMTATPRYFTGRVKREAQEADWEVASMDDEERFGRVLHRLTFARAIEQGLLSDYEVGVVGVSDQEARELAERGAFVSPDGQTVTDARTLAREIGLLRAMAKYDLCRIVTFHSRVSFARRFASSLPLTRQWLPARRRPSGTLWAQHVSGEMTAGERDLRLRQLRAVAGDDRGVLANARCLTEGVDVPTLDGVAFIDPRRSQVDVVQAVGRAIRRAEDKTHGTIVIPVFVTDEDEPESALESSEFDRVWQIVRALRDHDDTLAEQLNELRRELGRTGTLERRPAKIVLDLPTAVGEPFARAFDARLIDTATASWEFWFGLLQAFAAREGHASPPVEQLEAGFRLGRWVTKLRTRHRRGTLSLQRVELLERLPGWTWDAVEAAWRDGFGRLKRFAEREGHAYPNSKLVEDGFPLGQWVVVRRSSFKRGALRCEWARELESLPGWTWDTREQAWARGFSLLNRFAQREGHARPSTDWIESGSKLGLWVSARRAAYKRGALGADKAALLEALPGWTWNKDDADWEEGFRLLETFVAREGTARVPTKWDENEFRLGTWVAGKRASYRAGQLSSDKAAQLDALPGWSWHTKRDSWEAGYDALVRYTQQHGSATPPAGLVESGVRLEHWVGRQRQEARLGRLSPERKRRLERLPGWTWDTWVGLWERKYQALKAYALRTGNATPPHGWQDEDGVNLGHWVLRQRQQYLSGRLAPERVAVLEELPGWTWRAQDDTWENGYRALGHFVSREGHARVPSGRIEDGLLLGRWVAHQRNVFNQGRLSLDHVKRLESLPGWTWKGRADVEWEEKFGLMVKFVAREGHARIPAKHLEDGVQLGHWAATQRRLYRSQKLAVDRVKRLEALPGWSWTPRQPESDRPAKTAKAASLSGARTG
jgi:superfamily II DNA or RNA helicase